MALFTGDAGNNVFNGTDENDDAFGAGGSDSLSGLGGSDRLAGGTGADLVRGDDGDDFVASDNFDRSDAAISLEKSASTDVGVEQDSLFGGAGNDILYAGLNDNVDGGAGIDILSLNISGATTGVRVDLSALLSGTESSAQVGTGTISGIEGVSRLIGSNFDDRLLLFNTLNNSTPAVDAHSSIFGMAGNDTILTSAGVDLIDGGDGADTINAYNTTVLGGAGNDDITLTFGLADGGDGNDLFTIYGNRLGGTVRLLGGTGDDTFFNGNSTEGNYTVIEDGGAGNDNLGSYGFADTLIGGTGNDSYGFHIRNGSMPTIVETAGEGYDKLTVLFDLADRPSSFTLAAGLSIEELNLGYNPNTRYTPASTVSVTGNEYGQTITADDGANTLTGGGTSLGGDDVLIGLGGDDSYVVDSTHTLIIERANGGSDTATITSAANGFVLNAGSAVETLRAAAGTDAINITGNELAQTIIGNEGANILSGTGGGDTLIGLGGNDTYQVRSLGDQVIEANGGGIDTVFATVSYSLGANEVETLSTVVHAATDPLNLIGNYASQVIIGNYGNNILNGGSGGLDTLIGLRGDDTYAVGDSRTVILEDANAGFDTVVASVDYALAAGVSVEVLAAQNRAGTQALALTGNDVAQVIAGNEGANVIDGRGGADTLIGGGGADVFAFTTAAAAGNADVVADFTSGTDKIGLSSSVFGAVTDGGIGAGEFLIGTTAQDADDRLVYDQANGRLFYDADGNGSGAAVLLAQLVAGASLGATDFVVLTPPAG